MPTPNKAQNAAHQRAWRKRHPEKARTWRRDNPDKVRSMHLQKNFDLSLREWTALFEAQGARCACCGTTDPGLGGKKNNWATDHDHTTGEVRGIICLPCNFALGWLGDSLETVRVRSEQLVAYLATTHLTTAVAIRNIKTMSHRP